MNGGVSAGDIESHLKVTFDHSVPNDQPLVTHSINRGVPLVVSNPRSAVARAIKSVARAMIEDFAPEVERRKARILGLFGRRTA
jgi:pilus assembly protein CpaE